MEAQRSRVAVSRPPSVREEGRPRAQRLHHIEVMTWGSGDTLPTPALSPRPALSGLKQVT